MDDLSVPGDQCHQWHDGHRRLAAAGQIVAWRDGVIPGNSVNLGMGSKLSTPIIGCFNTCYVDI